jgi:hypothetical protein
MLRTLAATTFAALLLLAPAADAKSPPFTLAVIGDTPYGAAQLAAFPNDIADINADPDVRTVIHLGDIKNGSSRCSDDYFEQIRSDFAGFEDPLVYTPGDNEWTDCHRASNGGYLPTERLAKIRELFFSDRLHGVARQRSPFIENQRFTQADTVFVTLNIPGSDNDRVPWFGAAETQQQKDAQAREVRTRTAADLTWLDAAFQQAEDQDAAAVVIGEQADMWDPEAAAAGQLSGYDPFKAALSEHAREFGRPVLLLEGDSHHYLTDHPLADAPNVTRIVVQGSDSAPHEWLRLHVDPKAPGVFSWENVPFSP